MPLGFPADNVEEEYGGANARVSKKAGTSMAFWLRDSMKRAYQDTMPETISWR